MLSFKLKLNIFWYDHEYFLKFISAGSTLERVQLVPTTHLNVLSTACTRAVWRDRIYYQLPPHSHCLGNSVNCLSWPLCIWTDGKYLSSCQQELREATKIHLEPEANKIKNT